MDFLKKNIALVASIMSLLIIILSFACIINSKEKETLYIKDVKGDRNVLNDVVISGYLQDKYHGQKFSINNGEVSKEFKYYYKSSDLTESTLRPIGNVLYADGVQFSYNLEGDISKDANIDVIEKPSDAGKNTAVNGNGAQPEVNPYVDEVTHADKIDTYVNLYKRKGNTLQETVRVYTGVKKKSASKEFEFKRTYYKGDTNDPSSKELVSLGGSSYSLPARNSNQNNAFTFIDGELYFTVLSDRSASGNNGIFRVDKWDTWPNWKNKPQYGETTEVISFDLDKHNIDVLGIENVNNKLIIFMLIDNVLAFRAYDPKTGNLIDELEVAAFDRDKINGNYQAFVNEDVLSIHFNEATNLVVSVKFLKAFTLEHFVNGLPLNNENNPMYFENVTAIENKLFVFCYVTNISENNISLEELQTNHFMMFVYDKAKPFSKLLFKSEIMTDADQDKEYDRQKNLNSYAYRANDIRRFYSIQVKSK